MMDTRQNLTVAFLHEAKDTFNLMVEAERLVAEANRDLALFDNMAFSIHHLPRALKSLGLSMQVDYQKQFENTIVVDLELFLQIICICKEEPNFSVNEIEDTFIVFDRGDCRFAEKNDFKRILTKLGETVTDKEIEDQMTSSISDTNNENNDEIRMTSEDFITMCKNTKGIDYEINEQK